MKTLLILLALAGWVLPTQLPAVVLELRDEQSVVTDNLTLNDVLKSSQGLTGDDLGAVIADTPSLGKAQTWTRAQLEAILPATLKQQTLEWYGAAACTVSRPAVAFTQADVKRLITAELARHLPAESDFAILELPDAADPFLVPAGTLETTVELGNGSLRNEWGDATLKFRCEGQLAVTRSVRFHWAYTREVWQAMGRIVAGDQLTGSAFQQVEVNVLTLPGLLQPAANFPEGKVAARALAQGNILMETDWVDPVLVNRNDVVTILYDHHGVSITVQAKAMSNGVLNQVIEVQNVTSHKIFNARVVDERSLVYDE
jgi:flagella basal body P-ring formation protein FlgA